MIEPGYNWQDKIQELKNIIENLDQELQNAAARTNALEIENYELKQENQALRAKNQENNVKAETTKWRNQNAE